MDLPASPAPSGGDNPKRRPTGPLGTVVGWIDAAVEHAMSWGIVMVIVGLAPGLALWPLAHHEEMAFIVDGALDLDLRHAILYWMATSLGLVVALYGLAYFALRRRTPDLTFDGLARGLNRYTFLLACTPLITGLMHHGIEDDHYFITLTLIAVVTGFFGVFIHRVLELWPERPAHREHVPMPWLAPVAVVGLFVFYAVYMSSLALLDHRNLGTHVFDLGIYDNIFWHNANGDFMGCSYCKTGKHMSSHFDPILWILSFIYRLYPRAETLLVLQSTWLATGVFPLYLMAKRKLGNPWLGVLLGTIYVCYPALHGVNMFDFHSLTLVVPSLMWAIYFIDTDAVWPYFGVFGLMLITREDMSLLACFVGAYAILRKRTVLGLTTIVIALLYLVLIKKYVMADPGLIMEKSQSSTSFHHFYKEMIPHKEEGMKGLVITVFTNPIFFLKVLFKEPKVFFFLALLMPLCFLPLASGRKTVMMVYGLIFIGAATRKYVFSLHFQYSATLFPILMMALPDGIQNVANHRVTRALGLARRRMVWVLMWTCLVATLLMCHKYGSLWPNAAFRTGWNRLAWSPSAERQARYEFVRQLVDHQIPPEASISASSSLGSQLSNRPQIVKWPKVNDADYLLVYSGSFKRKSRKRLERLVKRGMYRLVVEEHGIALYQRIPDEERAEARRKARKLPPRPRPQQRDEDHSDDGDEVDDPRMNDDEDLDDPRMDDDLEGDE